MICNILNAMVSHATDVLKSERLYMGKLAFIEMAFTVANVLHVGIPKSFLAQGAQI